MTDLPGLNGAWITCVQPKAHHSDEDGEVSIKRPGRNGYAEWSDVGIGEPWRPRPHLDDRPFTQSEPVTNLITDRPPTADDGDRDGDVAMKRRPRSPDSDTALIHWSYVKAGTPWRHTCCWQPKRELPGVNGQWIRASAVMPTKDYSNIHERVEVYKTVGSLVWLLYSEVLESDLWRPVGRMDKRPLEPAGGQPS